MEKLLYIDIETTGLDKVKNGIIQMSGIVEINGEVKERFNFNIKPFNEDVWDAGALQLAEGRNITMETVLTFDEPIVVHKKLTEILSKYVDKYNKFDKFHMVGYNVSGFDRDFIYEWFKKVGDKYVGSFFWPIPIDVMYLASNYLSPVRHQLQTFKLHSVAEFLMVNEPGEFHDASFDIEVTRNLYKVVSGEKYQPLVDEIPWD